MQVASESKCCVIESPSSGPAILSAPAANLPTPPPPAENTINAAAAIALAMYPAGIFLTGMGGRPDICTALLM